jgi:hypothetical protein
MWQSVERNVLRALVVVREEGAWPIVWRERK